MFKFKKIHNDGVSIPFKYCTESNVALEFTRFVSAQKTQLVLTSSDRELITEANNITLQPRHVT